MYHPVRRERPAVQVECLTSVELREPLRSANHIRLLLVEPSALTRYSEDDLTVDADPTDPVRFAVYQAVLADLEPDEAAAFAALSYRWGDPALTKTVYCGHNAVPVHANLHDALVRLRFSNEKRLLWTDYFCINQADAIEKGQQVQRMGEIYRKAHTIIWLGLSPNPQGDEGLVDFLSLLSAARLSIMDWNVDEAAARQAVLQEAKSYGCSKLEELPWVEFLEFLKNTYFIRLWIVEEVIWAWSQELAYDRWSLSSYTLWNAIDISQAFVDVVETALARNDSNHNDISRVHAYLGSAFTLLINMSVRPAWLGTRRPPIMNLPSGGVVAEYHDYLCSDRRDHVYALVTLFGALDETKSYPVDYTLTVQEVFIDFALHCLGAEHDMTLLSLKCRKVCDRLADMAARLELRSWTEDLPSWCPDWGRPAEVGGELVSYEAEARDVVRWHASRDSSPRWLGMSRTHIGLQGIKVCNIVDFRRAFRVNVPIRTQLADIEQMILKLSHVMLAARLCEAYVDVRLARCSLALLASLSVSLHHGLAEDARLTPLSRHYAPIFAQIYARRLHAKVKGGQPCRGRRSRKRTLAQSILDGSNEYFYGKHIFITDAGLLGTGPDGLLVGDEVYILFGARVPFILRPNNDDMNRILIGEAHVPGLMYGEALEMGLPEQDIFLV